MIVATLRTLLLEIKDVMLLRMSRSSRRISGFVISIGFSPNLVGSDVLLVVRGVITPDDVLTLTTICCPLPSGNM